MLTEMAIPSDRMRFKDKIIANIAKAIKGIQEAVFFKNQATADDNPLILRNNDRQCHKLCENLDHVFLHGLRHHSHGYWKVVTEYTHKNAVREIRALRNVTTDLGRGRAWIFMALNDSLLESYIRCITDHTKMLKKHYVKDALLLDQQQMSVLLTLTSGLECVVFQLEYDLPYLDLTAYPPRARTASEMEEDEEDRISNRSVSTVSQQNTETAASTPESTKGLMDSDTASMCSLDTSAIRSSSMHVSSVSMDSGFPVDLVSIQSNKQRSVTPIDTLSISSLGSAGDSDRLTRLENMVGRADESECVDGGGLEVIRFKGGKKLSGSKKKRSSLTKKGIKSVSPVSQMSSLTVVELASHKNDGTDDCHQNSSAPIKIGKSSSEEFDCVGGSSAPFEAEPLCGKGSPYAKSLETLKGHLARGSFMPGANDKMNKSFSGISNTVEKVEKTESLMSRSLGQEAERLTAETKDSFADRFAQLDSAVANIRATSMTLHQCQHEHREPQQDGGKQHTDLSQSPSQISTSFLTQCSDPEQLGTSPQTPTDSKDLMYAYNESSTVTCDFDLMNNVPEQNLKVHGDDKGSGVKKMSALEELESKCAELCRPFSAAEYEDQAVSDSVQNSKDKSETVDIIDSNKNICKENDDSQNVYMNGMPCRGIQNQKREKEEEEEEVDFYNTSNQEGMLVNKEGMSVKTHSYGQLQDYVDYISGKHDEQIPDDVMENNFDEKTSLPPERARQEWNSDYALRLDNNTKLQIMLEVFTWDDEELSKMFVTREGHTEGDMKVTFVLVTNHTLYLLKQRESDHKFEAEVTIPLKDLNFISLSLNKQILNIESNGPNRRKERIWLTPGDCLLAQQILDCLEAAMKNIQQPTSVRSHFSIGSDEPLQTIALRKYIARDGHFKEQEVEIEDYSLVFWEDTQTNKGKQMSTDREGTMLLRVNDPFKGHMWKPVYVVLRDFMLCLFADKKDSRPQQYVRLGGEQCVGCRLATGQDRPYCIEIILAKGGSWFLSVASEEEVASWRHSLCLAVSEGMQDSTNLSCFPCVSVVTQQKLLLCHEDVQTKFCRTIASAKVEEVTALTLDPEVNTYCVVEFESQEIGVSSERWVLYFNSPLEIERFIKALSKVWDKVYQIPLSAGDIEDLPLQKHCQDQTSLLQRSLSLK